MVWMALVFGKCVEVYQLVALETVHEGVASIVAFVEPFVVESFVASVVFVTQVG